MYTDRSSEHSCHFFEGKSAYVTEVIWNAVGPFPIQPCSWPPSVSCKAQAGEFKKKKKKRQTYYTYSGYLLLLFFLTLMLASVLEYEARVGKVVPGLVRP